MSAGTVRSAASRLVVALSLLGAGSVAAQAPTKIGIEFVVPFYTAGEQFSPAVAMAPNGDFVAVWTDGARDGSGTGVFGRRFDSSGVALGADFQVNTYTLSTQGVPAVDRDASGNFVVVWLSNGQDLSFYGAFGRRFNAAGVALGVEFQVSVYTSGSQSLPVVGVDGDGDFVVAWDDSGRDGDTSGVFARRFASNGAPVGVDFQVNSHTQSTQRAPSVDSEPDGDFVIVWTSSQDGSGDGVFGQRFNSGGAHLGPEFQINSHFTSSQYSPRVAVEPDGDFVVVWVSFGEDGSASGIFGRRFDSSGAPQPPVQVNVVTAGSQLQPAVSAESDGDFTVAWVTPGYGSYDIVARRFKASGAATSGEFQVPASTANTQVQPAVATDPDGDFVVVWNNASAVQDQDDVHARRFDVVSIIDVDGDGQYLPLTDGLLMLRFGFGFTGSTLITGAVGAGCTRCDSPSILAYLDSLL